MLVMFCRALQILRAEQIKDDAKLTVTKFTFAEAIAVGSGTLTIIYSGILNDKVHASLIG